MSTKYTYSKINDFPNQRINIMKLDAEISAVSFSQTFDHINVTEDVCDVWFVAAITSGEEDTLDNIIANHDGQPLDVDPLSVSIDNSSIEQDVNLAEEYRDRSGKLRVHQTSRKLGLRICWTGVGDDTSDITKVGGGEAISFTHLIGQSDPMVKYIDFNIAENETWVHEGYLTWRNGWMDTLTLQIVPRTVTLSGVSGGDKTVYGGYLVIPTAPGEGDYEVVNDLTDPNGGLIYMPDNDLGEAPVAYWDADYNSTTHKYENIQPNYTGEGRYNIFSYEVIFSEFIRQVPFLAEGFIALASSDSDQLGQGMRLKFIADTNDNVPDHDWSAACIACLHRYSSV